MKKSMALYINILTICLLCFFSGSNGLVNSTIQACIEAFPDINPSTIRLTTTLPSLISLPVMIYASHHISKIGFRKSMILATLFLTIGGAGPYFLNSSWYLVLFFRCLTGVGLGFFGLRNALILCSFTEQTQAKFIGIGNAMNSLASVILTPIAGMLCAISWKHPYLLFLIGFLILLLTIFTLEEPKIVIDEESSKFNIKDLLDYRYIVYLFFYFLACLVLYPILSGMSSFIVLKNLGSLAIAGTLISCHNIGGFVTGFFTDTFERKFKISTIPLSFLLITVGQLLALYVRNVIIIGIGSGLTGVGFFILISTITVYTGAISSDSNKTLRSTLLLVFMQFGMFLSSYFIEYSHILLKLPTDVESSWLASALICGICTVLTFVFKKQLFDVKKKSSN